MMQGKGPIVGTIAGSHTCDFAPGDGGVLMASWAASRVTQRDGGIL